MKVDILGVQAFIAVADAGAFTAAAGSLHITQTALSRRIQRLEDFLGVSLFERTTRSVALTRLGSQFLPHARRLLGELEETLSEIRETGKAMRGDVTMACVPTVGVHFLPAILQRYSALHPMNRVRILDHSSSGVAEAVLRREAEFGINMQAGAHPELASVPIMTDRMVLVCPRSHRFARRKGLPWKALEGEPVIMPGHASGNRPWLDLSLERHGVAPHAFYEVQRSSTAVGMVAQGVGVAVVPGLAVRDLADRRLAVVPLTSPVVSRTLAIITRRNAQLSPAGRALHDLVVKVAARRP